MCSVERLSGLVYMLRTKVIQVIYFLPLFDRIITIVQPNCDCYIFITLSNYSLSFNKMNLIVKWVLGACEEEFILFSIFSVSIDQQISEYTWWRILWALMFVVCFGYGASNYYILCGFNKIRQCWIECWMSNPAI